LCLCVCVCGYEKKNSDDAAVAFEALCSDVVRRLESDGRLGGFESEAALCFYDDEEEEMKVTYVVHELGGDV
jgi:hypothetical protein